MNDTTNYRIYSLTELSNVMREISALDKQQKEIDGVKEAELIRVNRWHQKMSNKIAIDRAWRTDQVIDYHANVLKEDGDRKTLSTPYGKIKAKAYQASVSKPHAELLLRILKETQQTDYIKKKEVIEGDWASYKQSLKIIEGKIIDSNGEVIENLVVSPAKMTYTIEVSE